MIRYLLDTNVISEIHKPRPHGAVAAWFNSLHDDQIHLSAVTLMELQDGIERTRKQHPAKAHSLEVWVGDLENSSTIIPLDGRCFREVSRMMAGRQDKLFYDVLIAATARIHGFIIATRNEKDFKMLAVKMLNPFKSN